MTNMARVTCTTRASDVALSDPVLLFLMPYLGFVFTHKVGILQVLEIQIDYICDKLILFVLIFLYFVYIDDLFALQVGQKPLQIRLNHIIDIVDVADTLIVHFDIFCKALN